jgi:hypothetical protein
VAPIARDLGRVIGPLSTGGVAETREIPETLEFPACQAGGAFAPLPTANVRG